MDADVDADADDAVIFRWVTREDVVDGRCWKAAIILEEEEERKLDLLWRIMFDLGTFVKVNA